MNRAGSASTNKVENSSRVIKQSPVALQTVEPLGSLPPVNICVRETTPLITARMWFLCEILQDVQIKQKAEGFLGGLVSLVFMLGLFEIIASTGHWNERRFLAQLFTSGHMIA